MGSVVTAAPPLPLKTYNNKEDIRMVIIVLRAQANIRTRRRLEVEVRLEEVREASVQTP